MIIAHEERWIKARLTAALNASRPGRQLWAVRREDKIRAGLPDLEAHGGGRTSFLEAKHLVGRDKLPPRDVQWLTMLRLGRMAWLARYVIWDERDGAAPRTLIVQPSRLFEADWEVCLAARDHEGVAEWLASRHHYKP